MVRPGINTAEVIKSEMSPESSHKWEAKPELNSSDFIKRRIQRYSNSIRL